MIQRDQSKQNCHNWSRANQKWPRNGLARGIDTTSCSWTDKQKRNPGGENIRFSSIHLPLDIQIAVRDPSGIQHYSKTIFRATLLLFLRNLKILFLKWDPLQFTVNLNLHASILEDISIFTYHLTLNDIRNWPSDNHTTYQTLADSQSLRTKSRFNLLIQQQMTKMDILPA